MDKQIIDDFRNYLKEFKGIQAIGVTCNENKEEYFAVNIFKRYYKKNKKIIPKIFEGVVVELRIVKSTSFL